MKMTSSLMLGLALIAVSTPAALATDNMHGSAMMPTCAAGDPVVSMNPKTKMYVPADKEHMKGDAMKSDAMKGDAMKSDASDAMKSDAMKSDAMKSDAMKSDAMKSDAMKSDAMKSDAMTTDAMMMCKSKADAMGAHMMKG